MNTRTAHIDRTRADVKSRTVPCTISTDEPVPMGDLVERLDHSPDAVDLSRMPLPVITSHDLRQLPVGVFENAQLSGGKLRGQIRFGTGKRASEVLQDVLDGVIRSLSIGYQVNAHKPIGTDAAGRSVIRATSWQPHEVSIVSAPADSRAGFFRNLSIGNENMNDEDNHDGDQVANATRRTRRAAAADRRAVQDGIEEERMRIAEITAMARAHSLPSDLVDAMIEDGDSIGSARARTLEFSKQRSGRVQSYSGSREWGLPASNPIGMSAPEVEGFSLQRLVSASITQDWRKAGLERAACRAAADAAGKNPEGFILPPEAMQRGWGGTRSTYQVGVAGTGTTGGTLVETQLLADSFIEVLRNKALVMSMGATMLPGLVGNVNIPRRASPGAAYWVGESAAVTESEGTFDKIALTPHTVGALQKYSRQMLLQSTPAIEMMIRADLVAIIALAMDLAALSGLGSGGQPLGIANQTGINSVVAGTNGGNATFDQVMQLISALDSANAPDESRGFLMNGHVKNYLADQKTTTGQYLWTPGGSIADAAGKTLVGYPYGVTNQLRNTLTKGTSVGICSEMVYGAWEDLLIGMWGSMEVLVNPYDSVGFTTGDVSVRCLQTCDIQVRHAQSFAYIADLLTPGF